MKNENDLILIEKIIKKNKLKNYDYKEIKNYLKENEIKIKIQIKEKNNKKENKTLNNMNELKKILKKYMIYNININYKNYIELLHYNYKNKTIIKFNKILNIEIIYIFNNYENMIIFNEIILNDLLKEIENI